MQDYLAPALRPICLAALRSGSQARARQAAHFWACLMEQEEEEGGEVGMQCLPVLPELVPAVLAAMACLAEPEDCPGRAGDCLTLLARHCGPAVPYVALPLLSEYLRSGDWRQRYTCVVGLGCLGSGPDLAPALALHLGELGQALLADPSAAVRQGTGWALVQLSSLLPLPWGEDPPCLPLLSLASQALTGAADTAESGCRALTALTPHLAQPGAAPLLPQVLDHLLPLLLQAATLPSLLPPALAAVEDLASLGPPDSLLLSCISSLVGLLSLPYTGTCQAQLCSCLLSFLHLAQPSLLASQAERAASILLPLLPLPEVGEEALCCLGPVVEALGTSALPLLPSLLPTLHTAIQQEEPGPATAALGLLGDLYRALGVQLAPHSDPLLQGLLNRLASTGPQPALLLALTDAVLALGPHFSHYAWALVDLMGLMGSGPGTVACWSCRGPGPDCMGGGDCEEPAGAIQ